MRTLQDIKISARASHSSVSKYTPKITALKDGSYVAVWSSTYQDYSNDYGIFHQELNAEGELIGPESRVNSYTMYNQHGPRIASFADGGYIICWQSDKQDGSHYGVYAKRYDEDGVEIDTDEFLVNYYTDSYQYRPSVDTFSDGSFIITWDGYGENGNYAIYARRFDKDATPIDEKEFMVNTDPSSAQKSSQAKVVKDADGNDNGFVIIWESYSDVYQRLYDKDANAVDARETLVNSNTYSTQYQSNVAAFNSGGYCITWSSIHTGSYYKIYGKCFDVDGNITADEFLISSGDDNFHRYNPSTVIFSDDSMLVAYHTNKNNTEIYGQKLDKLGNKIGNEFWINRDLTGNDRNVSFTATQDKKGFFAVWEQDNKEIYGLLSKTGEVNPFVIDFSRDVFCEVVVDVTEYALDSIDQTSDLLFKLKAAATKGKLYDLNANDKLIEKDINSSLNIKYVSDDCFNAYEDEIKFRIVNSKGNESETRLFNIKAYAETNVNEGAGSSAIPDSVGLQDGTSVIVWSNNDSHGNKIYASSFDADGSAIGEKFVINNSLDNSIDNLKVVALNTGGFLVCWTITLNGRDVMCRLYDSNKLPIADSFLVNQTLNSDQRFNNLLVLKNGNIVVAWESRANSSSDYDIYYRIISADSKLIGDEQLVNTYNGGYETKPVLSSLDNNKFSITWKSGNKFIFTRVFDSGLPESNHQNQDPVNNNNIPYAKSFEVAVGCESAKLDFTSNIGDYQDHSEILQVHIKELPNIGKLIDSATGDVINELDSKTYSSLNQLVYEIDYSNIHNSQMKYEVSDTQGAVSNIAVINFNVKVAQQLYFGDISRSEFCTIKDGDHFLNAICSKIIAQKQEDIYSLGMSYWGFRLDNDKGLYLISNAVTNEYLYANSDNNTLDVGKYTADAANFKNYYYFELANDNSTDHRFSIRNHGANKYITIDGDQFLLTDDKIDATNFVIEGGCSPVNNHDVDNANNADNTNIEQCPTDSGNHGGEEVTSDSHNLSYQDAFYWAWSGLGILGWGAIGVWSCYSHYKHTNLQMHSTFSNGQMELGSHAIELHAENNN